MLAIQMAMPIAAFSNSVSHVVQIRRAERTNMIHRQLKTDEENEFIFIDEEDELDEATLAEVEAGKPSNWMVIQRVRIHGSMNGQTNQIIFVQVVSLITAYFSIFVL